MGHSRNYTKTRQTVSTDNPTIPRNTVKPGRFTRTVRENSRTQLALFMAREGVEGDGPGYSPEHRCLCLCVPFSASMQPPFKARTGQANRTDLFFPSQYFITPLPPSLPSLTKSNQTKLNHAGITRARTFGGMLPDRQRPGRSVRRHWARLPNPAPWRRHRHRHRHRWRIPRPFCPPALQQQ